MLSARKSCSDGTQEPVEITEIFLYLFDISKISIEIHKIIDHKYNVMINNNKLNSSNSLSVILLVFFCFLSNLSFAADSDANPDDFSNAENAEEKRAKWGTEEFKLELIKEMSSANIALFIDEHLKTITEPSRIYYKFQKESTREDNFVGNVVFLFLCLIPIVPIDATFLEFKSNI